MKSDFYPNVRKGDVFVNTFGTRAIVIAYINSKNVLVEFQDDYKYQRKFYLKDLREGQFTNPYDKTMEGRGFVGVGKYSASKNSKKTLAYIRWSGMMHRCYSGHNEAYSDVEVSEEWHNFQNFAEWFYNQDNHGEVDWELDKDLLSGDFKLYSTKTCCILPAKINTFISTRKIKNNLPTGVREVICNNGVIKYIAKYKDLNGKYKKSEKYETMEEAFDFYALNKKVILIQLAEIYKEDLSKNIYLSILKYKIKA